MTIADLINLVKQEEWAAAHTTEEKRRVLYEAIDRIPAKFSWWAKWLFRQIAAPALRRMVNKEIQ